MGYDEGGMKCRVVIGTGKGMGYAERRMKCRVVVGTEKGMGSNTRERSVELWLEQRRRAWYNYDERGTT